MLRNLHAAVGIADWGLQSERMDRQPLARKCVDCHVDALAVSASAIPGFGAAICRRAYPADG